MVLDIGAILASLVTLLWKNYKEKVDISVFSNNIEKYVKGVLDISLFCTKIEKYFNLRNDLDAAYL